MKKYFWLTIAILGAALILFLFVSSSLFGNWNNVGWGMMGGWPEGTMHEWGFGSIGWFGMILMWIIPIGFIVLVVLGVVGLVRVLRGRAAACNAGADRTNPSPDDHEVDRRCDRVVCRKLRPIPRGGLRYDSGIPQAKHAMTPSTLLAGMRAVADRPDSGWTGKMLANCGRSL